MPPKKKAKTAPIPDDPEEYITHIREKSGKRFESTGRKKNVNYDIEQNVREIRALLKINAEIFDRCIISAANEHDGKMVSFTRYSFDVVRVRPYHGTTQTHFVAEYDRSSKNFDMKPLSELPAYLNGVFVVNYQNAPYTMFIDYDALLQSAIMLHDDVLGPFLAQLKRQIESIHVSLGRIESWLLEPSRNIGFLEATFKTKLKTPTADDFDKVDLVGVAHGELCSLCNKSYGSHYSKDLYKYSVVVSKDRCYRAGSSQMFTPRKKFHLLQSCNEPGRFEKTFSIAKKCDQNKLQKFLAFMAS